MYELWGLDIKIFFDHLTKKEKKILKSNAAMEFIVLPC